MFKAVNNYPHGIKNVKKQEAKYYIVVQSYKLLSFREYKDLAELIGARVPGLGDEIYVGQVAICLTIDFLGDDRSLSEEELREPITFTRIDRRRRGNKNSCPYQYYRHKKGNLINYVFISNK